MGKNVLINFAYISNVFNYKEINMNNEHNIWFINLPINFHNLFIT